MSDAVPQSQPTGRQTLGPLVYAMPIMPPVLIGGPMFLAIPTQNIPAMIAALVFGIGLMILWLCVLRIAQRLDQLDADSKHMQTVTTVPPVPATDES